MTATRHRARKRFGQNFLTDELVIQRIVDSINPKADDLVIEIGPGQAALSRPLLDAGVELHLIEIDRDLVERLKRRFESFDRLYLHEGDALKLDFSLVSDQRSFRLVGNLPYNISTPLLFHVLQWSKLITDMHFMLQREVVERMAAKPGSKSWGRLSIMCQYHCNIMPLFGVSPESFSPAPRVHSTIVKLVPHPQPPVDIESFSTFSRVVSQAFSMRRKTLRNSLRGLLDATHIEAAGIDPGLRPEMLSLQQFADLAALTEIEE